jgi:hypothetical protein
VYIIFKNPTDDALTAENRPKPVERLKEFSSPPKRGSSALLDDSVAIAALFGHYPYSVA